MFAFFFLIAWRILARLGFFPIEFGLNDKSLNLDADGNVVLLSTFSLKCPL